MRKRLVVLFFVFLSALVMFAGVVLVALRLFFLDVHFIPQSGMYPTFARGAYVVTIRRPYDRVEQVSRGDVVVFVQVRDSARYLYIWRVVGLPGDRIVTEGDSLIVNDEIISRELVREENGMSLHIERAGEVSHMVAIAKAPENVPPDQAVEVGGDQLFVMGDNRFNAYDSRFLGTIPFSAVVGKVIWPRPHLSD